MSIEPRRFYSDPILDRLRDAADRAEQAHTEIRLLAAYSRHFTGYRPYRLADLADACGMSMSGVRRCFTPTELERISAHADENHTLTPAEFLDLLDQLVTEIRDT
jgi:hypothetical protein